MRMGDGVRCTALGLASRIALGVGIVVLLQFSIVSSTPYVAVHSEDL
jgi:hypothetical protein